MGKEPSLADSVRTFLFEAKKSLYDPARATNERRDDDGVSCRVYERAPYRYRYSFVGGRSFMGEDVVWKDGIAVWGMSYHGKSLPGELPAASVMCLKAALRELPEDTPYRGPAIFRQGGYEYSCSVEGDIDSFDGLEKLASVADGSTIYELRFHGGFFA